MAKLIYHTKAHTPHGTIDVRLFESGLVQSRLLGTDPAGRGQLAAAREKQQRTITARALDDEYGVPWYLRFRLRFPIYLKALPGCGCNVRWKEWCAETNWRNYDPSDGPIKATWKALCA